jgi:hypothetical protein
MVTEVQKLQWSASPDVAQELFEALQQELAGKDVLRGAVQLTYDEPVALGPVAAELTDATYWISLGVTANATWAAVRIALGRALKEVRKRHPQAALPSEDELKPDND